jgi:hypothetical protein
MPSLGSGIETGTQADVLAAQKDTTLAAVAAVLTSALLPRLAGYSLKWGAGDVR